MKIFLQVLLFFNLFFGLPLSAYAFIDIDIQVKDKFYTGEIMSFNYRFVSTKDEFIEYLPQITCDNIPDSLLDIKQADLKAGNAFYGSHSFGELNKSFTGDNCQAQIFIISPDKLVESKFFDIVIDKDFSLVLNICPEESCSTFSRIFVQGEEVYLDYTSDIIDPSLSALLVTPQGYEKNINLPSNFLAEEIGNYTVLVSAEKSGYRRVMVEEKIGVIGEHVDLSQTKIVKSVLILNIIGWAFFTLLVVLLITIIILICKFKDKK